MTYVKTTLQHSIDIDAIITLHYFEYMKNLKDISCGMWPRSLSCITN